MQKERVSEKGKIGIKTVRRDEASEAQRENRDEMMLVSLKMHVLRKCGKIVECRKSNEQDGYVQTDDMTQVQSDGDGFPSCPV